MARSVKNGSSLPKECADALINIWRKRVEEGDAVFVHTTTASRFLEGIVEELNFEDCWVAIRTPSGLSRVPLTSFHYIQVVCPKNKVCDGKSERKSKSSCDGGACENAILNIWETFSVGDSVFVDVQGTEHSDSFEAVIAEINWKYCFVGLETVSGITYIPLTSFDLIERLCDKRSKSSDSSSSSDDKKKSKKSKH